MEGLEARPAVPLATDNSTGEHTGYAYASRFRNCKAGYRHTEDITLLCNDEHTNKGVGCSLLNKLQ